MTPLQGEDKFQEWVQLRVAGTGGHYQDHRFSAQNDVPDLSCAVRGKDYWLELKYGHFKLLHAKYDDFAFATMQRGQLEWLEKRAKSGRACGGVLAYFTLAVDHPVPEQSNAHLFFMTARHYLELIWQKKMSVGAILLSPCTMRADQCPTGQSLFAFIDAAARRPWRNARQLRV